MGTKRCSHGREKRQCRVCNPCPYAKQKSMCSACTPCPHGKVKSSCLACNPCPHGKLKSDCVKYGACPHGKVKGSCVACKAARADPPSSKRIKYEQESSPEIKQEPEPFTIRGYFGIGE